MSFLLLLSLVNLQTLLAASPPDDDFDCSVAQLPDNMDKNRSKVHLPGILIVFFVVVTLYHKRFLQLQLMITGWSSQQMAINRTTSVPVMLM